MREIIFNRGMASLESITTITVYLLVMPHYRTENTVQNDLLGGVF